MTKKFHLYIDDTGNRYPDKKHDAKRIDQMDCFGLGGVIIREEDIIAIQSEYDKFCEKWRIDYPLHSVDIRGRRGNFNWLNKQNRWESFWSDLEGWLLSLPIVSIACVIHRPGYVERYKDYHEHLWYLCKTAYSILIERSAKFAERQDRKLEIFFEQAGKYEDGNIIQYAKELKEFGPPFSAIMSGAYEPYTADDFRRVVLGEPLRRKKTDPICQIADLVLYPIAKGRYDPEYRPFVKLREGGKLIDSHLEAKLLNQIGIKYSCFDGMQ